jgi:hypothetical protein
VLISGYDLIERGTPETEFKRFCLGYQEMPASDFANIQYLHHDVLL